MAVSTTTRPKKMVAKYPGSCSDCGGSIARGSQILWSRGSGVKHLQCSAAAVGDYEFTPCWAGGRCEDAPCCGCGEP